MESELGMPSFVSHVYWVQKEQFQLPVDTYGEWVLFVVEEGAFRYGIAGKKGVVQGGELVLCPPGTPFRREARAPVTFHFLRFTLDAAPDVPFGHVPLSRHARVADNCAELRRYASDRSDLARMVRVHILHDLWLMILKESLAVGYRETAPATDPVIHDVRRYLAAAAYRPLQLREVAHRHHLSPVQLTRRFSAAFGMPPLQYVTELRLGRACERLADSDDTIDAIASACGYENGFYLSRIFTRALGITPSAYRRNHRV